MKSTLFLVAAASFATSATAAFFDECFITQGATKTEWTYSFSIHDIQTEICDLCSTTFAAAAPPIGVTLESFSCFETPVLPAIGADAVFAVLYNDSSATAAQQGEVGAEDAFVNGIRACLPGISFVGCPEGNASP
jgi:hypothetical protein